MYLHEAFSRWGFFMLSLYVSSLYDKLLSVTSQFAIGAFMTCCCDTFCTALVPTWRTLNALASGSGTNRV